MNYSAPTRFFVTLFLLVLFCAGVSAQQDSAVKETTAKPSAENTAKAEAIVNRGIEVLGGNAYLNVQTVVGRGFFTAFQDGLSQIPPSFSTTSLYPDKERTEFTGSGIPRNSDEHGRDRLALRRRDQDLERYEGRADRRLQEKHAHQRRESPARLVEKRKRNAQLRWPARGGTRQAQ